MTESYFEWLREKKQEFTEKAFADHHGDLWASGFHRGAMAAYEMALERSEGLLESTVLLNIIRSERKRWYELREWSVVQGDMELWSVMDEASKRYGERAREGLIESSIRHLVSEGEIVVDGKILQIDPKHKHRTPSGDVWAWLRTVPLEQ